MKLFRWPKLEILAHKYVVSLYFLSVVLCSIFGCVAFAHDRKSLGAKNWWFFIVVDEKILKQLDHCPSTKKRKIIKKKKSAARMQTRWIGRIWSPAKRRFVKIKKVKQEREIKRNNKNNILFHKCRSKPKKKK